MPLTPKQREELRRVIVAWRDQDEPPAGYETNEDVLAEIVGEHPGWYELAVRDHLCEHVPELLADYDELERELAKLGGRQPTKLQRQRRGALTAR